MMRGMTVVSSDGAPRPSSTSGSSSAQAGGCDAAGRATMGVPHEGQLADPSGTSAPRAGQGYVYDG